MRQEPAGNHQSVPRMTLNIRNTVPELCVCMLGQNETYRWDAQICVNKSWAYIRALSSIKSNSPSHVRSVEREG